MAFQYGVGLGVAGRLAVESKLSLTAVCPSVDIASARTGPPWPRNCAEAVVIACGRTAKRAAHVETTKRNLLRRPGIRDNRFVRSWRRQGRLPERVSGCPVCRGRGLLPAD